jgi:hypothetical protein
MENDFGKSDLGERIEESVTGDTSGKVIDRDFKPSDLATNEGPEYTSGGIMGPGFAGGYMDTVGGAERINETGGYPSGLAPADDVNADDIASNNANDPVDTQDRP